MTPTVRRLLFLLVGLALLLTPLLLRWTDSDFESSYAPPEIEAFNSAATPVPTATPIGIETSAAAAERQLAAAPIRPGPVVVDLAHFNRLDRSNFQQLAAALAERGVGLRFWLPQGIDPMGVQSFETFPDQSAELSEQLSDASALVIISPYFLWSVEEIEEAQRFVADGGRLLLISDPDIVGDLARDINNVGEPFGVVFHDDYLYDVEQNDENFTYVFQGDFLDEAAALSDYTIALYGTRSLSGSVEPQVRGLDTTLSSKRTGFSRFTTVAIGGLESNGTRGNVLAMGDFNVLSDPFVERYDNRQLLGFVSDFLAGGTRTNTVIDFPASLGQEVALVYGSESTVDAALLFQSAQLQRRLVQSGRELTLARTAILTDTGSITSTGSITETSRVTSTETNTGTVLVPPPSTSIALIPTPGDSDLIYLGDFETAFSETTFLSDMGFVLVEEFRTPTPGPTASVTAALTATEEMTATPTVTPSATSDVTFPREMTPTEIAPATATPSPTPSPTLSLTASATASATGRVVETATPTPTATDTDILPATEIAEPEIPEKETPEIEPSAAFTFTPTLTPTPTPTSTPSTTPRRSSNTAALVPTFTATPSPTATETATPTQTAIPTATPTPERILYLESESGLRLLAEEVVLIIQRTEADDGRTVAVLAQDTTGINAGVMRLLDSQFDDCILEDERAICPFTLQGTETPSDGEREDEDAAGDGGGMEEPTPDAPISEPTRPTPVPEVPATPLATETPGAEPNDEPPEPLSGRILLIDDNDGAAEGEESEADSYVSILNALGYDPDRWNVSANGRPGADTLNEYAWVIWSSAGYAAGGPTVDDLDPIFGFMNEGGRLTISSRTPFFGEGQGEPSAIFDAVVTDSIPELVRELPEEILIEAEDLPLVSPLQANPDENPGISVILRRGPGSENTDAPLLFVIVEEAGEGATGARLMVLGMSIAWFPDDVGEQLVQNTAEWMLGE